MARYFFHTADGSRERDTEGTELPSADEARVQAVRYAGEILSSEPKILWEGDDFRIEVTDEQDMMLFTIITLAVNAPSSGRT